MTPKVLKRCSICNGFHASYLVEDPVLGTLRLCYKCWKARFPAQPGSERGQPPEAKQEEPNRPDDPEKG